MSSAQASQPPITLYSASATSTQEELSLLIPNNLDPGFQSISVSIIGSDNKVNQKTFYFCKTLTGNINWNNKCPDATVLVSQATLNAISLRTKLPPYNPRSEPKKTTDLVIASLAAITVASTTKIAMGKSAPPSSSKQQGYLSQVAKGGLLLGTVLTGPGDKLRAKQSKTSVAGAKLTALSTRTSAASPLASRILSDGNYLRATMQRIAHLVYPLALGIGFLAAKSVSYQAMPPAYAFIVMFLVIGIFDSLAGVLTVLSFGLLSVVTGHVTNLSEFLTLMGISLIGFSPILLASVFRPLRRTTDNFSSYWERVTDYLVASLLTGWVVKQIILGLSGLSGLQLPITAHAHALGVIAGVLVIVRYGLEDFSSYLFPGHMSAIEPSYRDQSTKQYLVRIIVQIAVFLLVAEPFLGPSPSLWIGLAIFTIPLILSLFNERLPKSQAISRWIPKGIIEMITMTFAGFLIARILNWYPQSATGYVLTAFVLLGIPGFILKLLPLFADEPSDAWKESSFGKITYRVGGVVALVLLGYIVTTGIILSNNL